MNVWHLHISRRTLTLAAALVGMVSLAIGAHAALNKRSLDAAKAAEVAQITQAANRPSRLALVIGNGHYPDANAPLTQPINDARAITAALRREGFEVDVVEDASRDDISRAVDRLKARIAVIDASRRNPYERRFRAFSHGLAPISAPDNALILSSATPGKVADDSSGQYSVLMTELLNNLNAPAAGVEA